MGKARPKRERRTDEGEDKTAGRRVPFALILGVLAAGLAGVTVWFQQTAPRAGSTATPAASADSGYVDPELCASCHSEIAESFARTGMGRSFYRLTAAREVENFQQPPFFHSKSQRYYRVFKKDGRYFQRRHQVDRGGQEINVVEKEIHYVLGSGNHARTYLHRTPDGRLLELPLAWYSENGGFFAMNPGYDQPGHYGFRRALNHDCLACHNRYPDPAPVEAFSGGTARFPGEIGEGIDCQRCHGPGRRHMEATATGGLEKIRAAIVNPARLEPRRQLEICLQCHLESTSRRLPYSVTRFEQGIYAFRPGRPLADFVLHFDRAPEKRGDHFEIAHAGHRFLQSKCFRQSPSMTCTTCHDPHSATRGEEARARYAAICRNCHQSGLNAAGGVHTASADCIGCHMPKRRTEDVVHVVMTDHWIQRRKPSRDLLAPVEEVVDTDASAYRGEVVPLYPADLSGEDELYAAIAQVQEGSNVSGGLPRLNAAIQRFKPAHGRYYFELAEAYVRSGNPGAAEPYYQEAIRRTPTFLPAWRNYGVALREQRKFSEARSVFEQGLTHAPGDAALLNNLGDVLIRAGQPEEARRILEKAVAADPDLPEAQNNLGEAYVRLNRASDAQNAFRAAIRSKPEYAMAYNNLANSLTASGRFAEAKPYFEQALALDPKDASAYLNYGIGQAGAGDFARAEENFRRAVSLDDRLAAAHTNLGNVLGMRGDFAGAQRHLRRALALDPNQATTHYNLALTLLAMDDTAGAEQHFRASLALDPKAYAAHFHLGQLLMRDGRAAEAAAELQSAAASPDPKMREAARQLLNRAGP